MPVKFTGTFTIPVILELYSGPALLGSKVDKLTVGQTCMIRVQAENGGWATHYRLLDMDDSEMTRGPLLLQEEMQFGVLPEFATKPAYCGDPITTNHREIKAGDDVEVFITLTLATA